MPQAALHVGPRAGKGDERHGDDYAHLFGYVFRRFSHVNNQSWSYNNLARFGCSPFLSPIPYTESACLVFTCPVSNRRIFQGQSHAAFSPGRLRDEGVVFHTRAPDPS